MPKNSTIVSDREIRITPYRLGFQLELRLVTIRDEDHQRELTFLTNHLELGATTIARIYKERWQIELYCKSLKQLLRVRTFVGTGANALKTQMWTALIAILLLKYLQLRSSFGWSLSNLVAMVRQQLFVYRDLLGWLDDPFQAPPALAACTTVNSRWASDPDSISKKLKHAPSQSTVLSDSQFGQHSLVQSTLRPNTQPRLIPEPAGALCFLLAIRRSTRAA